jgi:hypothetical protein
MRIDVVARRYNVDDRKERDSNIGLSFE